MKERQSNFELLRIVATLFIVVVHCNGWFINGLQGVTDTWYSGGYGKSAWRIIVQSITCIGVNLFVLISGYFAIKPKWSSIINLFTCLSFFYVGCYLMDCFIGHNALSFQGLSNNILAFSHENWFIQCYLFLMLLAPMANAFMDRLTEKKATCYLIVFIIAAFYFGCLRDSTYFYFNQGYSVTTLLLLYLIGRYINLFLQQKTECLKSTSLLALYIMSVALISAVHLLLDYSREGRWLSYCSPLLIISSVLFFLLFCRINVRSRLINWIGGSCLAVFILHTSSPIIGWLSKLDASLFMTKSLPIWGSTMAIVILGVFVSAILLDKVRILLSKPLLNIVKNLENRSLYGR